MTLANLSTQRKMLHVEGLVVLVTAILLYAKGGYNGWLFLGLLLAPDLAFIVYAVNKTLGIHVYNAVHTYTAPLLLGLLALALNWEMGLMLTLIWTAHIGMDRTVGYGLKYVTDFNDTHLQRI